MIPHSKIWYINAMFERWGSFRKGEGAYLGPLMLWDVVSRTFDRYSYSSLVNNKSIYLYIIYMYHICIIYAYISYIYHISYDIYMISYISYIYDIIYIYIYHISYIYHIYHIYLYMYHICIYTYMHIIYIYVLIHRYIYRVTTKKLVTFKNL